MLMSGQLVGNDSLVHRLWAPNAAVKVRTVCGMEELPKNTSDITESKENALCGTCWEQYLKFRESKKGLLRPSPEEE